MGSFKNFTAILLRFMAYDRKFTAGFQLPVHYRHDDRGNIVVFLFSVPTLPFYLGVGREN